MNSYSDLLQAGAAEARNFSDLTHFNAEWIESIARRMEVAGALKEEPQVALAINTIARLLNDSGPTDGIPSFWQAVDAMQRRPRRSAK